MDPVNEKDFETFVEGLQDNDTTVIDDNDNKVEVLDDDFHWGFTDYVKASPLFVWNVLKLTATIILAVPVAAVIKLAHFVVHVAAAIIRATLLAITAPLYYVWVDSYHDVNRSDSFSLLFRTYHYRNIPLPIDKIIERSWRQAQHLPIEIDWNNRDDRGPAFSSYTGTEKTWGASDYMKYPVVVLWNGTKTAIAIATKVPFAITVELIGIVTKVGLVTIRTTGLLFTAPYHAFANTKSDYENYGKKHHDLGNIQYGPGSKTRNLSDSICTFFDFIVDEKFETEKTESKKSNNEGFSLSGPNGFNHTGSMKSDGTTFGNVPTQ